MSVDLMALVWKVPFPTSTQMLIALKLADHGHDDGTNIFPGPKSVSERARCSVSTVKNTLRLMRECGLLIVVEKGGKTGPHDTTVYRMNLPLLEAFARKDLTMSGTCDAMEIAWSETSGKMGVKFDPSEFYPGSQEDVPVQPAGPTRAAGYTQTITKHKEPSGARARASDVDTPPALAAKKKRLVLSEDTDWWQWLSVVEATFGEKGRRMFEVEGAMVVFDDVPVAGVAAPPKLPPPRGSALYSDLVKARDKRTGGLTERSKAMTGEAGEAA